MVNDIRRTLDELVSRYKLEPSLCDIYVEGKTDKLFLEWFLNDRGIKDFAVYDIDTIDLPTEILLNDFQLKDNKRSRVIALALYLQKQMSVVHSHVICIADKDFDWLLDIQYECDCLFFTDYSCLEMYLFNQKVLNKFLLLSLRISDIKAIDIIDDLSHILDDLFLIRAAREVLKIDVAMLDNFGKCCTWNNSRTKFQFDIQGYLNKDINKSQINANKSTFLDKIEELRIKAQNLEDRRYKIHGHDFTELLYVYIKDFLRKKSLFMLR